jgi:hypothetical protein
MWISCLIANCYRHALRMCNIYRFSTATGVARTLLSVTFMRILSAIFIFRYNGWNSELLKASWMLSREYWRRQLNRSDKTFFMALRTPGCIVYRYCWPRKVLDVEYWKSLVSEFENTFRRIWSWYLILYRRADGHNLLMKHSPFYTLSQSTKY